MNARICCIAMTFSISLFSSANANAIAVLATSDLPAEIQSCFAGGSCTSLSYSSTQTAFQNTFQSANISAFQYRDNNVDKWLVRYNAFTPSHSSGNSYNSFTGISNSYNTPLTGNLWLSANQSYDLASSNHMVNAYFDKISPSISFFNGYTSAHFNLTSADLLAGGGYSQTTNLGNTTQGSLISGPGPDGASAVNYWSCIECDVTVQFNLAMLKYSSFGSSAQLSFNPADPRALVFKKNEYNPFFGGSGNSSSEVALYVQPVPLPASFWLLASGLMGLRTLMKRKIA